MNPWTIAPALGSCPGKEGDLGAATCPVQLACPMKGYEIMLSIFYF